MRARSASVVQVVCLAGVFLGEAGGPRILGDTVYLKNGAWIDGLVVYPKEGFLQVQIGEQGKLEIPMEDVYEIEKNKRGLEVRDRDTQRDSGAQPGSAREPSKGSQSSKDAKDSGDTSDPAGAAEDGGGDEVQGGTEEKSPADDAESHAQESEEPGKGLDPELKETIQSLIEELQRNKPQSRVRAERHLKAIGEPALPFLLKLCDNDSELVRVAVFRLLSEFGDESTVDACIAGLLDSSEFVRGFAFKCLERVTRESFGYQANAAPRRREQSHRKWVEWWKSEKAELERVKKLSTK